MSTLLPGFFANIDLGKDPFTLPSGLIDVSGLNFAIALCEDDPPIVERFTTWGMQADAATLYQALSVKNTLIIGDAGACYVLDEEQHDDDGVPIPTVYETMPLPEDTPEETITTQKRLHYITWQLKPTASLIASTGTAVGIIVKLKITDVDNAANFFTRTLTQFTTKMRIQVGLRARQWVIRWQFDSTEDIAMLSFGQAVQIVSTPYAPQV